MIQRLLKNTVVRNALLMYGVQFSTYLLPLATVPYLSRVLSPEKYGLLAFAQAFIWYFLTLTEYGFNLTATRQVAIHAHDPEKVSQIFSAVMIAKLVLTLLGFVILLAVTLATPQLRPDLSLFIISFLAVIGNLLFPVWLFQGLQKMQHVAARDFLAKLVAFAALFLLVHKDSDYLWAAGVQAGGQMAAAFIGLATVPFVLPIRFRWPGRDEVVEALRGGFPVFLSMAAMSLTSTTNTFIIGVRGPLSEVAYFSNAQRLIVALRMLVGPLVTAIYPHISMKAADSRADAIQFLRKYRLLLSAPFLLLSLAVFVAAPVAVRILLGPKYAGTVPLLRIMAFSPMLLAISHLYSTYYMLAFGYQKQWARIVFVTVIVNFALLLALIPFVRASIALAIVWIALDVLGTALFYIFYRLNVEKDLTMEQGLPMSNS